MKENEESETKYKRENEKDVIKINGRSYRMKGGGEERSVKERKEKREEMKKERKQKDKRER